MCCTHGALDLDRAIRGPLDRNLAVLKRYRVTERNQLVGALNGHDSGDDRGIENRSFFRAQRIVPINGGVLDRKSVV